MDPQAINSNSRLRASDADRDRAASVLNEALAEGRLTADEHSERLDSIYAAKTQADLVPLLEDLPAPAASSSPVPAAGNAPARAYHGGPIIAIFGGAVRKGRWRVPPSSTIVTVFGGADIDLRDAVLPGREITIKAVSVFGGMSITVPPEMRVVDSGIAVFGGRDVSGETPESEGPNAPLLRIQGACVFGGISVRHKQRKTRRN
ncbi:MAG TPA: DUF1707 domain-containing protein [Streptosporangiaceae bacterium]|nr:DUF1707 domain-containing protein [Streptosporangiaceae bacterium]